MPLGAAPTASRWHPAGQEQPDTHCPGGDRGQGVPEELGSEAVPTNSWSSVWDDDHTASTHIITGSLSRAVAAWALPWAVEFEEVLGNPATSPGLGPGELLMHHPPWRAALEDRALDTSGLGERRSCHSRTERKDLCAAHTSVTSGSSAPLPGKAADGNAVAGTRLARAPWAELSPLLPACPAAPQPLPFHPCHAVL